MNSSVKRAKYLPEGKSLKHINPHTINL